MEMLHVAAIVSGLANALAFIVTALVNGRPKWFSLPYNVGDMSRKNTVVVTPPNGYFSIWGIIYAYNAASIVYTVAYAVYTSRTNRAFVHSADYHSKHLRAVTVLSVYNLCFLILNVAWVATWCNELIHYSLYVILFLLATQTAALVHGSRLANASEDIKTNPLFVWFYNQCSFATGWIAVATCLSFVVVITYTSSGVPRVMDAQENQRRELFASVACASVLLAVSAVLYTNTLLSKIKPVLNVAWTLSVVWGAVGALHRVVSDYEVVFSTNTDLLIALCVLFTLVVATNLQHFVLMLCYNMYSGVSK